MDILKVKQALHTVEHAKDALDWLEEYGLKIKDCAFDTKGYASACPGAKEASFYLSRTLRQELEDFISLTIAECKATLAEAEQTVKDEAAK